MGGYQRRVHGENTTRLKDKQQHQKSHSSTHHNGFRRHRSQERLALLPRHRIRLRCCYHRHLLLLPRHVDRSQLSHTLPGLTDMPLMDHALDSSEPPTETDTPTWTTMSLEVMAVLPSCQA